MQNTNKTAVYFMPGMAASPRIFEFIHLPEEYEIVRLSWMLPKQSESLRSYASRMCERITHQNPVLVGVSFGGILVQEMAKHIDCHKVIIISSVKSNAELSRSMRLMRTTGAHKLFPTQWIESLESLSLFVFGSSIESKVKAYQKYLSERDPAYLDWSIDRIVHWDQEKPHPDVIHVHGDTDTIFPIKNIDTKHNFYSINNGSHAMILTHHKWFNTNLPKLIQSH